jgi:hypothetical protein
MFARAINHPRTRSVTLTRAGKSRVPSWLGSSMMQRLIAPGPRGVVVCAPRDEHCAESYAATAGDRRTTQARQGSRTRRRPPINHSPRPTAFRRTALRSGREWGRADKDRRPLDGRGNAGHVEGVGAAAPGHIARQGGGDMWQRYQTRWRTGLADACGPGNTGNLVCVRLQRVKAYRRGDAQCPRAVRTITADDLTVQYVPDNGDAWIVRTGERNARVYLF